MKTPITITTADINASIGSKTVRARLLDGTWVEAARVSAFLEPLRAEVLRTLTAEESAASDIEVDGPRI